MRKWLKRAAVSAACSAVLAAAFAAAAGWLFLERPGTLLTSRTVGAGLKRFGARWSPRWTSLRFSAVPAGRFRHRYTLDAANFCVDDRDGAFSACFSELDLTVVVRYTRRGPVLERVDRLVASADRARLDLRRLPPRAPRSLPDALRTIPAEGARLTLTRLTLISSGTTTSGDLRLVLTPGAARPLSVSTDLAVSGRSGVRRLRSDFSAAAVLGADGLPEALDFSGRAELGRSRRMRAAFRARREALRYVVSGGAEIESSTGPVSSLKLSACAGSAPLRAAPAGPSAVLTCRYELKPSEAAARAAGGLHSIQGGVALSGRVEGRRYEAGLKADVEPVRSWYVVSGGVELRAAGRLDRPWSAAVVTHDLHAAVEVARFEDLVARLKETKYAIPAPVHVLKGPLSFSLASRGDPRSERQTASYEYSSDLSGTRQRLAVKGSGTMAVAGIRSPGRRFEHDGELVLEDVALEAPRLEIGRPPKVFLDKRIHMDEDPVPVPPEAGKFTLPRAEGGFLPLRSRLSLRTRKPLILYSNLAKDPVPVTLDLTLSYPPGSVAGLVEVRPFGIELFRRKAQVDHMNVVLSPGSTVGKVDGLIRYKTPSVMINILIMGTTLKPRIELTSVPPLKREDILALLIFGKDPAELDPEQVASVGNTETALESQAFGLGSLYFFGTTSVERVAYDSATRTASVKVRLPGGADLAFGSDFDQSRQLSLRKLLAPHWALESDVTDQGSQQSMAATTFLEWFNRY